MLHPLKHNKREFVMSKFEKNDRFTTTELGKKATTAEQQNAIFDLALKEGKITNEERLIVRGFSGIPPNAEITELLVKILIKVGLVRKIENPPER